LVAFENKENLNHENYHKQSSIQTRTKLAPRNFKNENNIMRIDKKVENVFSGITIKNTINVNKKSKTKTALYAPNYMSKNKTVIYLFKQKSFPYLNLILYNSITAFKT
jgi:hypothetical protein